MALSYFDKITSALSFNGNFNDWSKYSRTVANEAGVTMSQDSIKFGSYSAFFSNGLVAVDDIGWSAYQGDFCIDLWLNAIKATSNDLSLIIGQIANDDLGWGIFLEKSTDTIKIIGGTTAESWAGTVASGSYATRWGIWTHIAVQRKSGTTQIFVDGVPVASSNLFDFPATGELLQIGGSRHTTTPYFISGYMSDLRMIRDTHIYTENESYTLPTALSQGYSTRSVVINVKDSTTGRPVQGAQVTIVYSQFVMSSGSTDSLGNVTLIVPATYSWVVTATKTGYVSSSAYIEYQTSSVSLGMRLARSQLEAEARYKAYNPVIALINDSTDTENTISNKGSVGGYLTLDTTRVRKQTDSDSLEDGVPYLFWHTDTGSHNGFNYSDYSVTTELVQGTNLDLNVTSTGGTWSIWVKPNRTMNNYTEYPQLEYVYQNPNCGFITSNWFGDYSNAVFNLHVGTNYISVVVQHTNAYNYVCFKNPVSLIGWNHVVVTIDAFSKFTLYLNGTKIRSLAVNMGSMNRWFANTFGGYLSLWGSYIGSFTEYMCLNRDINETEVRALYQRQYYTLEGSAYLDQSNNPIPSIIRVYDRETGDLVSDTVTDQTGKWSVFVTKRKQYDVVCSPLNIGDLTLPPQIISGVVPE